MQLTDHPTLATLHVGVGNATHQGGRPRNEDYAAVYIAPPSRQLTIGVVAALADGMGGAKGGRVAAELAVRGFIDGCLGQPVTLGVARIGARAADAVNRWIHTIGRCDADLNGMASTLSALVLCGRSAYLVHVGDSRVYRLRDNDLVLLTRDHTLGAPGTTNALTRAMGALDNLRVDHFSEAVQVHDRYLLCSDGVHGVLSSQQIRATLAMRAAPQETAQRLIEQASGAADADNATAVVLDVLGLPETQYADMELAVADQPLRNAPASGDVIDDYEIGEMLADGQHTRVFRAVDKRSNKQVVLKFPKPRPGLDALLRTALLREMWIASHVRSPFVTEALEPPTERRTSLYGVLPFYEGETLESRLKRGPPIGVAAGLDIAEKLTKGVASLHRAGIIHRDIKPENVMLEPGGSLKIIDLGVAMLRQFDEHTEIEKPGTRSYMAPELFAGSPADEGTDLFALGVTLYRMFSGGPYPYGEVEPFAQPRFGRATPLSKHRPDIPAWLEHCVMRSISLDPRERHGDAVEFAFELENGSLKAVPKTLARRPLYERNPVRFWQVVSALLAIALLVSLAS